MGPQKRRNSAPEVELLRGRRRSSVPSRPSYVIPKKEQIRSRRISGNNSGIIPRAVSPINFRVKEYLSRADEKIEDYMERIVKNVHDKAENAQIMVQHGLQLLRDWKACHFDKLPAWMRDNEYLHFGHRPELRSFATCFRSIFRIHTETGNIWTHLIGFLAMVVLTIVFYVKPLCDNCHQDIQVHNIPT